MMLRDEPNPSNARVIAALLAIATLCPPLAAAATARPPRLDLKVAPSDVAPAEPRPALPDEPDAKGTQPDAITEIDRGRHGETRGRVTAKTGTLDGFALGDGLLQDLLEDKTIPLFRVKVAPPF